MIVDCEVLALWHETVFVVMPQSDPLVSKKEIAGDLRDRHFVVSEAQPGGEISDYLRKHLAELWPPSEYLFASGCP